MTKRQPTWKKKGYKSPEEYSAACRANRKTKKAAMLATKTENKDYDILRFIWEEAEFDKPICSITKEQIVAGTRAGISTVKAALRTLREEGSLIELYTRGGRGLPSRYRLGVAGQDRTPSDEAIEAMQGKRDRDAAWRYLSGKFGPLKAMEMMGKPDDDE